MSKKISVPWACAFGVGSNLILFFVKLYIGLRTNSISIYSDAVNNAFDSLSSAVTLVGMVSIIKHSAGQSGGIVHKGEQLFSFIISIFVAAAGCYFAYSSLERLIYPTPIWFATLYVYVIAGTAVVKALMLIFYSYCSKKCNSTVINMMKTDCVLDFFMTLTALATLLVSRFGLYAFDALCGIVISLIMVTSAVKMLVVCAKKLINYVQPSTRQTIEEIFNDFLDEIKLLRLDFQTVGDSVEAYAFVYGGSNDAKDKVAAQCLEKTGVTVHFVDERVG